jgi:hypothetical protein
MTTAIRPKKWDMQAGVKPMSNYISLFLILSLGMIGCGVQGGRFTTTGSESNALAPNVGCIDIITGLNKKQADETGLSDEQNLLYILIITSGIQEHGSSGSNDYGRFVTTLNHSWNTDKGTFAVSIPWNRETDMVTIGKQEFLREKGNVFVVKLNAAGEIVSQQFASLGSHSNFQQMLDYIHQQLPNDKLISSVKLYK